MNEIYPAFFDYRSQVDELLVLLVSDIRCNLSNVHKLAEFLTIQSIHVDMIWVTGNLILLNNSNHTQEVVSASEGDTSAIISALENIQCRVAYVPGHHDPPTTRVKDSPLPRLTSNSCNLHNRCLRVADDLVLLGFDHQQNPMAKLESYIKAEVSLQPETESELQQRLMYLTSKLGQDFVMPGDSVIVLSHCTMNGLGQDQVDCSKERHADGEGWKNLIANKRRFPANLSLLCFGSDTQRPECIAEDVQMSEEGSSSPYSPSRKTADSARQASHSTPQSRVIELDGIPCIYPGAFSKGNFCILKLRRCRESKIWQMAEKRCLNLHDKTSF